MAKIFLGINDYKLHRENSVTPFYWDTDQSLSRHGVILGNTGAGKTTTLRGLVSELSKKTKARIHLLDVHGDLHMPNESVVKFSESTHYGLNPLALFDHPHFGGVRKRIQSFIYTINSTSFKLMVRQEAALRALLSDLYDINGFKIDDSETWNEEAQELAGSDGVVYLDVPYEQREQVKSIGRKLGIAVSFNTEHRCWTVEKMHNEFNRWPIKRFGKTYPTLDDLIRYAHNKTRTIFMGSNSVSMNALDEINRLHTRMNTLMKKLKSASNANDSLELADLQTKLADLKKKNLDSYKKYLDNIVTGYEIESILKYNNHEVVKSVLDRLESLKGTGIFKPMKPPFDPNCRVWRSDISPLAVPEQKLFAQFYIREIFERRMAAGETDELIDVIIADEAKRHFDEDPNNIFNVVATEARKFGMSAFVASQSPKHISEEFLSSAAIKIILGVDPLYWGDVMTKMKLQREVLDYISPHKRAAMQIRNKGQVKHHFSQVNVENALCKQFR